MPKVCPLIAHATAIWFGPHSTNAALTCGPLINILCDKVRAVNCARQTAALRQFNACHWLFVQIIHANAHVVAVEWVREKKRKRGRGREQPARLAPIRDTIKLQLYNWKSRLALPCLASPPAMATSTGVSQIRHDGYRCQLVGEQRQWPQNVAGRMSQLRVKHFAYAQTRNGLWFA